MAEMGLDFKPPAARSARQWSVLQSLWVVGETFHSCGCGGPGYRPRSPAAYREFLTTQMRHYEAILHDWQVGRGRRTARLGDPELAESD
jgi:hypothetical protein